MWQNCHFHQQLSFSVTTTKVRGEEEIMKTKEYRVRVNALGDSWKYSVKAIGIPSIGDDITAVQQSMLADLLCVPKEKGRMTL